MADKRIHFEITGKGWQEALKHVSTLRKALKDLKGDSEGLGKALKGIDTAGGFAKFNKEITKTSSFWKGISKEAGTYVKTLTNESFKKTHIDMKRRIEGITKSIENQVKFLKETNKEAKIQEMVQGNILKLINRRYALQKETARMQGGFGQAFQQGGIGGVARAGLMKMGVSGGMLAGAGAALGAGAAAVGAGVMVFNLNRRYMAAKMEREQTMRESEVAVKGVYQSRATRILEGKGQQDAMLEAIGATDWARKRARTRAADYMENLGWGNFAERARKIENQRRIEREPEWLVKQKDIFNLQDTGRIIRTDPETGYPFRASKRRNFFRSSWDMGVAGIAGVSRMWGSYVPIKATWQKKKAEVFEESIDLAKRQNQQLLYMQSYANSNAASWNFTRRAMGAKMYGEGMVGDLATNPLRQALLGNADSRGFTNAQAEEAMMNMYQVGGARGIMGPQKGGAIRKGLEIALRTGVENAPQQMATLGLINRTTAGEQEDVLKNIIAEGMVDAMTKGEMKLESQAYTQATIDASRRIAEGSAMSAGFVDELAKTMKKMLPDDYSQLDIQQAVKALEVRKMVYSGPMAVGIGLEESMNLLGGKGGKVSDATLLGGARHLSWMMRTQPEQIKEDNKMMQEYYQIYYREKKGGTYKDFVKNTQDAIKRTQRSAWIGMDDAEMASAKASGPAGAMQLAFNLMGTGGLSPEEGGEVVRKLFNTTPKVSKMAPKEGWRGLINRNLKDFGDFIGLKGTDENLDRINKSAQANSDATKQSLMESDFTLKMGNRTVTGKLSDFVKEAAVAHEKAAPRIGEQMKESGSLEGAADSLVTNITNVSKALGGLATTINGTIVELGGKAVEMEGPGNVGTE